jgi:thiol-disulfide isomerase/thioredoxin
MRNPSRPAWAVTCACVLLLAACSPAAPLPAPAVPATPAPAPAASTASAPGAADATAPETVKEFPTLEVETFAGGHWSLAERRGKWVVVNFWATWCNPCLKEIPELDAFDKARGDVEMIGLAYEEIERPDMEAFLKEHAFAYPVALVDVYKGLPDFPIPKGLPMTYVIAPDGRVAKQFLGPVSMDELKSLVGAPPETPSTP